MEKRKSNNPAGRPKNSTNKNVSELREIISKAISGEYENLSATLDKIVEPEKRLEMVVKLTAFVVPKLQTVKHEDTRDTTEERVIEWQTPEPDYTDWTMEELLELRGLVVRQKELQDKYWKT